MADHLAVRANTTEFARTHKCTTFIYLDGRGGVGDLWCRALMLQIECCTFGAFAQIRSCLRAPPGDRPFRFRVLAAMSATFHRPTPLFRRTSPRPTVFTFSPIQQQHRTRHPFAFHERIQRVAERIGRPHRSRDVACDEAA